jgi:tetratricopeptide (TPR) repeat protein
MSNQNTMNRVMQAVEALKALDRNMAVSLLHTELRLGAPSGDGWLGVSKLARQIGELDISVEASRRYALTDTTSLDRQLYYWGELANVGRSELALEHIGRLPIGQKNSPILLHFLGTISGEQGDFVAAEDFYRRALAVAPHLLQTWFALAMVKTFSENDPDLVAMERQRPQASGYGGELNARFLYGLAKAYRDCGEHHRAFAVYHEGALLRSGQQPFDGERLSLFADHLINDFSLEGMAKLQPSNDSSNRVVFVNGLPRSGSTLIEQILTSHSCVSDGGEVNLIRAAFLPTGDYSFGGALAYQRRAKSTDPWKELSDHYHRMISMRFGEHGRVVDKTLSQSQFMGLVLHALPKARIIWVRRAPQDAALSCFQTFFSSNIPWSWSFGNIGKYFAVEDRLFNHWTALFPERILVVPYEELVSEPEKWIPHMLVHAGLPEEPQVYQSHLNKRSVRTASVQQVRRPISTSRIGSARDHEAHLAPFWKAYRQ